MYNYLILSNFIKNTIFLNGKSTCFTKIVCGFNCGKNNKTNAAINIISYELSS